jgi:hypothetical protein
MEEYSDFCDVDWNYEKVLKIEQETYRWEIILYNILQYIATTI